MRKVYVTFSNDSKQIIHGPFWTIEHPDGSPNTDALEDLIDAVGPPEISEMLPTIWFDTPPQQEPSA